MYAGRFDSSPDGGMVDACPDGAAGPGPDVPPEWPPDVIPVALWPQATLQDALARGVPGASLAQVVADATNPDAELLEGLSDDALGDLVVACVRLQSWAAGLQARVVAERAARESYPLAHNSLIGQVTAELVVTEPEATDVVVRAEAGAQHPTVIQALVAGRIDVRKAHTLLRSASQLTVAERAEAIDRYLPQAPRRTWKWLQHKLLAFAKDRHGAGDTAKAAAQRRSVHVDRADNDMGWLSAYLPATDAAAVWGVVDDMAHQLRHVTGEGRTLNQLRADSLTGIVTGRLLPADRLSDPGPDPDTDAEAAVPTTDDPGSNAGAGASAGAGEGAGWCGEPDGTVDGPVDDTIDGGNLPVCTCGGRAPVVRQVVQELVRPVRITPTRPVVRVTVPASVLLGLDDTPGHLDGFGPIPADTARTIAQDATWQRLLTDPVTGVLLDYSTTTYQPGKVLRAAVEARDGTCMFLWCDTPASRCDLDHIEPFDHERKDSRRDGGQTRASNLHALCRKHHLLKTHAGWGLVRDPATGITTWTTPTGRTHTRPPTVLDTHIHLDQIDPDTSEDLTLRALTGQHPPRQYATIEPGALPTDPDDQPADTDEPPF